MAKGCAIVEGPVGAGRAAGSDAGGTLNIHKGGEVMRTLGALEVVNIAVDCEVWYFANPRINRAIDAFDRTAIFLLKAPKLLRYACACACAKKYT
jgi:hypothetical protein